MRRKGGLEVVVIVAAVDAERGGGDVEVRLEEGEVCPGGGEEDMEGWGRGGRKASL